VVNRKVKPEILLELLPIVIELHEIAEFAFHRLKHAIDMRKS